MKKLSMSVLIVLFAAFMACQKAEQAQTPVTVSEDSVQPVIELESETMQPAVDSAPGEAEIVSEPAAEADLSVDEMPASDEDETFSDAEETAPAAEEAVAVDQETPLNDETPTDQ